MTGKIKNSAWPTGKMRWVAVAAISTPVLGLLLWHFGLEFGFVIAAVGVVATLAYRIHTARLEQKTRLVSEASRIHLATVEALATAIDARDQVGAGHVRRTQIYAVGMGRLMGVSESEINAIRTGALLHDIGKLAVPDHILNKTGELTPAEFEKTKIHSRVGASILEKVGFIDPVVPTVKYHHESWDGTGYPDGLRGENIPLTARILAVADAFDTLRGARPYRAAMSRDEARQIIQAESGSRFDPAIVDVLLRNLTALDSEVETQGLAYGLSSTAPSGNGNHNYVEQIKLANREVFSLYELARDFSGSGSLNETLRMFSGKIAEFVPFDTCAIYLLDDAKSAAAAAFVSGDNSKEIESRVLKVGRGATGYALGTRETVQNVDPGLDFYDSHFELASRYSTMASVPMIDDGELIGAVSIYSYTLETYGEEHIRLLETVSRIAADAVGKCLRHDEARTHAMTDPMTGLPNARSLQAQFDREVARASRGGTSFQLLMLDLDRFKAVNDSFGHKAGDDMLREVSRVIRGQLRDYDFLARYGGDEFVALIPETTPEDVIDLCNRIERAVSGFTLNVNGKFASVGVSLGGSGYPQNGKSFDEMIIAADKAMYLRKAARRVTSGDQLSVSYTVVPEARDALDDIFIVELDERHVVASAAIN